MSRGRGSAGSIMVVVSLVCLLVYVETVCAETHTVGGPGGWTFNVLNWPKGKQFKAGDEIIFNYDPTIHNVVAVNKEGYKNCKATTGATTYNSGQDQIKLSKGKNYFICASPGHCDSGMKIAINAV